MPALFSKPKAPALPPAPPPLPVAKVEDTAEKDRRRVEEDKHRKIRQAVSGRAGTTLTSGAGLLDEPSIDRPELTSTLG